MTSPSNPARTTIRISPHVSALGTEHAMRHPTWGVILLAAALLEVSAASHARKAHGTMNEEEDEQEECTQGAPFVEEPEPTEVSWLLFSQAGTCSSPEAWLLCRMWMSPFNSTSLFNQRGRRQAAKLKALPQGGLAGTPQIPDRHLRQRAVLPPATRSYFSYHTSTTKSSK